MRIIPSAEEYRDEMMEMVRSAKKALGREPRLNEDLLDVRGNYLDKGDMFFLAVEDGRVLGCGGFSREPGTDEAFVHRLYVRPDKKRRGIGSALLCAVEEAMRERGVKISRVHMGAPREQWFESYSFYPARGYEECAPRYMWKKL